MYSRCLVCRSPFPETGTLETLRQGDRVAFDIRKGRLWLVCRSCRRWSLVPLESRWEALEELEHRVTREGRVISRTSNVTLVKLGPLEIVRIGSSDRAEEAWWRYGRQLPERATPGRWVPPFFRRLRYGPSVWVGSLTCSGCGFLESEISFSDGKILVVKPQGAGFTVTRPCPRCKGVDSGGLRLSGISAELALARITAFYHETGESRVTVRAAARLVEEGGEADALIRLLTRHGKPLGALQPIGLTALDIAVSAARERTLMQLEVEALQARWRREEELAALVDGELSPLPRLEDLIRRTRKR
jgi:hypothetical protein